MLTAIVCLALFVFIIKGWWKDAMFSVWSYIIGAILFLLLAFQCTMIIGSLKIIDTADEYKAYFTEILDNAYEDWEQVPDDVAKVVIDKAIEECPLLEHYIGGGEFTGFSAKELPTAITEELRSFMKAYIVRRLLWCLGFTLIAGILGIMTLNRHYAMSAQRGLSERRHSSGSRSVPNESHRPRINTHRRR
ncbi:MAG: hypothetical protein Q4F52_05700 [Bacteroidaceae bacterium]|nr:hypothetical protein [Bacteroidaceae bacterium]